jgi:hypothetical protein
MNPHLFISNFWSGIKESFAQQIIMSYATLSKSFSIKSNNIPPYLRILKIENSDITDSFCVCFSKNFLYFPYLEILSFSNSPNITMFGKIFFYLTIF